MGVMGWTPDTVADASLSDLHDACLGWLEYRGLSPAPALTRRFLEEMMQKFPDERKHA